MITIGTRVAFSRAFLRNTSQFTGWAPFARGVVVGAAEEIPSLVTIRWDDRSRFSGETGPSLSRVNIANLVREDRIHLES